MFESSVLFLELNSTKPSLIYDNLPQNPPPPRNRSENVASTFTMCSCDMRRNIDCEISTSFSGPLLNACHKHTSDMSINHRLRSRRPIGITSAFRITQTYFGHVNKPSTEEFASHRHYFGFPNYVLTHLLTTR